MASKKKLDDILKKVSSGTLSVKSDVNQTRSDTNHTARGATKLSTSITSTQKPATTQSELSKPAKITADVSGEAWTRATPSQVKLPSGYTVAQQSEMSRLQEQRRQAQVDMDLDTMNAVDKRMKEIRKEAGNEFSAGKLATGIAEKGIQSAFRGLSKTAAMAEDIALKPLEWMTGDNTLSDKAPLNTVDRWAGGVQEKTEKKYRQNITAGGKAAEVADKYGAMTIAALPQSLVAMLTGGTGAALQGTTKGLEMAATEATTKGTAATVRNVIGTLAKRYAGDKNFWTSFAQTTGDSYQQALADGAPQGKAALEAIGSGLMNAAIEVGGGIQALPTEMQKGESAFRTWVDSLWDEGKEEVTQGVVERAMQNLVYGKGAPVFSTTDPNAVLNPRTAGEEFMGGAVVGGILSGGQMAIQSGVNAMVNAQNQGMAGGTGRVTKAHVDAQPAAQYNETKVSPAASAEVQKTEAQAQVTQAENPDVNVLDAATTLFTQQGMKLKTAQEKAAIVQKLIAGEEVSVRDINKLNPTSKESQAIFTQLTGVQFPEGKVTQEQLYNLYRSANTVAVEAREQQRAQQAAQEAVFQQAAMERVQSVQEQQETPAAQEQQTTDTLTKQMADAGFQANPETQDRIAQAQAELNDAVNGTATAASRKTGNTRNSITLNTGDTLTRGQFKQVMQELYAEKGVNLTDNQLDAAFNNFLSTADRGGDISGLEAMAEYLKSKEEGNNDGRAETGRVGEQSQVGRPLGAGQEESGAEAENRHGADRGGEENRTADPVYADDAVRSDSRDAGDGRGPGEVRGGGQEAAGDGVLREVRGEPGRTAESGAGESVTTTIRRMAKRNAEAIRKKAYPTQKADVGTGVENDLLPEKYWPRSLRRAAKTIRAAGGELYVTMGPVLYTGRDGKTRKSDGLTIPDSKKILVRADSNARLPGQIAGHEMLHLYMLEDSTLLDWLRYRIFGMLGDTGVEDFDNLLRTRYASYAAEYGDFDENYDDYLAEFFCDLNGDVRDRVNTSDENFDAMRSVVVKEVKRWEAEQNYLDTERNSTNQNSTGRPSFALTTEMTWDEQVDTRNDGNNYNAMYLEETPNILAEVGLGDLPLCMTKSHLNDIMHAKDPSNPHWHGVQEGVIRKLPELLSKPAMILRSASTPGDIVVVLQASDSDGNPIVATVHPNGRALVDGVRGPANFITSVYPRSNFAPRAGEPSKNNLLYLALRDKGILYWNKERTEALAQRCRLQLPQTLSKVPSDTILKQYEGYVKGNTPKRLFSMESDLEQDNATGSDASDSSVPDFNSWNSAYQYFENAPDTNITFDALPGGSPEVEIGVLDSHGKWAETLGVYPYTKEGLAQFNKDVKEFVSVQTISEEELNELFPATYDEADDYAEDYSVGEWDVPPDPYQSQMEGEWEVQQNRDGFTNTDTKAFRKWFKDDTGRLTNPDGQPKVFLRGAPRYGRTKLRSFDEAESKGLFFTTAPSIASSYAAGIKYNDLHTLMDAVKGDSENNANAEWKPKYFRGWGPAKDYILRNFQANGGGLRLVGIDADGNVVDKLSQTDHFSLQANTATEEQYKNEGWFVGDKWRELASYPKTKEGLEKFNLELGDHIRNNDLGVRGYAKFYLSAEKTLVVDADGARFDSIPEDLIPAKLWSPKNTGYSHINGLAYRAFSNGYDCVIVDNVSDLGGDHQTQYVVKDGSQVKSVYNRGTWEGNRPDFLFSMAENEDHRQKLEDFFKKMEEEYGGGSAEAMFKTFEQLDRARQRAEERAADAEAAQQAAEWATEAAVEAAKMAERERADKKLQKQKDAFQEKARQKAAEARLSKAKAVRDARLAEQMNSGRQWSEKLRKQEERFNKQKEDMKQSAKERMNQLRSGQQKELEDTKLAERMNAGRKVAQAKRKGRDAVAREKEKRAYDHKMAGKDAKTAAAVLRKYHKTDVERLTNAPVNTIREAYHKPTARDAVKAAADKLRTLHREVYKVFVNGTQAIDDFSKYQNVDATTSVLLRTAMASGSTVQTIKQDRLVGKDGSTLDERSFEDVIFCWDGSGKHRKYNDDKQRILQDYMLHRHNIDRMSFREKALNAVESYEQSYPWLASLSPTEFAELVADNNRIAQRYQELIEQFQKAKDKPIFTDEKGSPVTSETSRNMVAQYEQQYAWVKEKAEGIYDWWDKFMQEWVVGDSLSAEEYAALRETYPAYVPTYRKDKPGLGKGASAFAGTVTAKKAVRAATGGTSAVANIEDSYAMLLEKSVSSQRTNMVLRSITDTAMLDETGDFNGFAIFDWDEAPEMLRWGLAAEGFEGALEAGTDQAAANALSDEGGGKYRVRAWANGQRVSAFVDKEIYKALEFAFNQKTSWITKLGQTLTSPMKTFITGINPAFAIRNTIRDNFTAQMNSISVVNSISGIKFEKYYAKAWQEMVSGSDNWQHFVALGGTNAGYYNNEGGTYITNLNRRKMQDLNPVNKVGKALGFIGEHTEQVTRFAEYLATIDRLPGGDTYGNRLIGIKNAAEVTVDFSRKGTAGKFLNAWIPYWNPGVQGIDKTIRTFFDQPTVAGKAKVLSRAALTTLPLDVILFALYHALDRDDEWEKLDDRTKDAYYCIPMQNEHKFLKIPKSRDWGQIIGNPIMRMLQGLDGREDPFENYIETSIAPNFNPLPDPRDIVLFSTAYDLAVNKDFAGRTIIPYNYQKVAKGDQWNDSTSRVTKAAADVVNWISQKFVEEDVLSPMQMDYFISDYFGDFGDMFLRSTAIGGNDESLPASEQAKLLADDLFGNWEADNRYSNASVSDYYDMLDKIQQVVDNDKNHSGSDYKDTPMYKLKSALNADGGPSAQITELNAKVRELPDGPEKDEIKGQIVELAREALQMYDAVMSGDITEPKMEMEYSKYGDKVKNALTDLADYSEDYAFLPSDYKPSSYTDPKNKNKEYVLDDAAKAKYRELYDEEYASVMEEVIKSSKYRSASAEKRAELLEAARDDVAPQVKEEFLKWLAKNYKSTPKKK